MLTGTAGAVVAIHAPAAGTTSVAGTSGAALTPPGLSSLEQGAGPASSDVSAMSCASADNCSAAGYYPRPARQGGENSAGYVVNEVNGTWHTAIAVPGLAGLSQSGPGHFYALSCGAVANCSAGGIYDFAGDAADEQAFLVSEK
jgi:hypothetical protein